MSKKYTKKYDKTKKEYVFSLNGKEDFRIFRAGFGGIVEWTGISKWGSWGFPTLRSAVVEMMGWTKFQEYMKGRKRV